jgi:hypothetical protein
MDEWFSKLAINAAGRSDLPRLLTLYRPGSAVVRLIYTIAGEPMRWRECIAFLGIVVAWRVTARGQQSTSTETTAAAVV